LGIVEQEAKQKLKATVHPVKQYLFFKCPTQREMLPHILAHRMISYFISFMIINPVGRTPTNYRFPSFIEAFIEGLFV
jgi:hypothetical protein